jgi:putative restriction endonuclease
MFDRGLIAVGDDLRILALGSGLSEDEARLILSQGILRVPADDALRPHPQFLSWHRKNVFKE